jgi:hypothetical protein
VKSPDDNNHREPNRFGECYGQRDETLPSTSMKHHGAPVTTDDPMVVMGVPTGCLGVRLLLSEEEPLRDLCLLSSSAVVPVTKPYKKTWLSSAQGLSPQGPDSRCRLRRSTQHLLGVYSLEFEILEFFLDVD